MLLLLLCKVAGVLWCDVVRRCIVLMLLLLCEVAGEMGCVCEAAECCVCEAAECCVCEAPGVLLVCSVGGAGYS